MVSGTAAVTVQSFTLLAFRPLAVSLRWSSLNRQKTLSLSSIFYFPFQLKFDWTFINLRPVSISLSLFP